MQRTLLAPSGPIRVQIENIIEQEKGIRSPGEYRAVLTTIACGRTRRNEIATAAGLAGRTGVLRHILGGLEDLGLIWHEQNFAAPGNAPLLYRVADNAVRFWYRFVDANRSALERGGIEEVWQARIEPYLDGHMGRVFEGMAAEAFKRRHADWRLPAAAEWARWEGRDRNRRSVEIDLVARLTDGSLLTGEVKWSSSPVDMSLHTDHLRNLEDMAASGQAWAREALPDHDAARFLYISAAGFGDDLRAAARTDDRIRLVDLDDLYSPR